MQNFKIIKDFKLNFCNIILQLTQQYLFMAKVNFYLFSILYYLLFQLLIQIYCILFIQHQLYLLFMLFIMILNLLLNFFKRYLLYMNFFEKCICIRKAIN